MLNVSTDMELVGGVQSGLAPLGAWLAPGTVQLSLTDQYNPLLITTSDQTEQNT